MNTCLNGHIQAIHPTSDTGSGVGAKSRLEKISRPTITLEDTIAFVEARETGARSLSQLLPGSGSHHTNKVDVTVEKSCWRFLEKGHYGRDPVRVRRVKCKAFDVQYIRCSTKGHYAKNCKPRGKDAIKKDDKDEEDVVKSNEIHVAVHSWLSSGRSLLSGNGFPSGINSIM